jgi:hypothetical protein
MQPQWLTIGCGGPRRLRCMNCGSAVSNAPLSSKHRAALKQTWSDGAECSPSCAQCVPVPADAAFRISNQRAISAFTKRPNVAGVRSLLAGIDPPSSATFAFTAGSSRDWSSAAASLSTMGVGRPRCSSYSRGHPPSQSARLVTLADAHPRKRRKP